MKYKITIQDDLYSEHNNLINAQNEIFILTNLLGYEKTDIKIVYDSNIENQNDLESRIFN